jgi:hypothetical protein
MSAAGGPSKLLSRTGAIPEEEYVQGKVEGHRKTKGDE